MFALVESIIILGIVLLVVALLSIPFRFMRNHYLALCVVSVLATAVWTIGIQYNDQTLRNGSFLLIALGAAGYIATILVLCALIIRSAKFSDIIVSIAERLSILLYTLLSGKGLSDKGQTERGGKKNPP
ncbi:hypothetical protein KFU94_07155 [Chloroflexi bacterium TSY]|nr:hypothetical protein [Chloroflexi bacterium TSY]